MNFRLSWPNHTHFLLSGAQVELTLDGTPVPLTVTPGGAEGTLPAGSGSPPIAVLTVEFRPALAGTPATVLRVRQTFALQPPSLSVFSPGGPQPAEYTVRPAGATADVAQKGRHPLVHSVADSLGLSWRVIVHTDVVDATAVQPLMLGRLSVLRAPGPHANVRILARTDGKLPLHYICATPPASTSAPATDVLCFLTAPQNSPVDVDTDEGLLDPAKFSVLGDGAGIFLGTGIHDDNLKPRARDHFSPGSPKPNLVLPRRWEEALMASGKHVALVLPVPSGGRHNTAASGDLPIQLGQVHGALIALGDIAAPAGPAPSTPLLGLAAHSLGGPALFAAVTKSAKSAFSEIWLFEARSAAQNVETVARTTGARVLYAGYERSSVEEAFAAAKRNPALAGRVSRLPDSPPPPDASPAVLARSSPLLTHMLEGIVKPATAWKPPRPFKLPNGELYDQRFEVLHQLIVQGNDADGAHFLTKALKRSALH
jgi:hypothetical protein